MTDGERLGDEGVRLGPIQWAVVTSHLVPSGLFLRLEDSGEKAFILDAISLLPFLVTFASYGLWPPVRLPAVVVLVGSGFLMLALMNDPDVGNSAIMFITALVAVLGLLTVKTIESKKIGRASCRERV